MARCRIDPLLLISLSLLAHLANANVSPHVAEAAAALPMQCQDYIYSVDFMGPQRTVMAGDVRLAYHRFGPWEGPSDPNSSSRGPALVFIMGYTGSMYAWPVPMLQEFSREREVIIFDNPGIGNSSLPGDVNASGLSIQGMADITVKFIQALELHAKPPDVIGWSMGGFIALTMAAHHGSTLGNVVVLGSRASGNQLEVAPFDLNPNDYADLEDFTEKLIDGLFPHGDEDPGLCMLLGSIASSQYPNPEGASRQVIEMQWAAISDYFCDAGINYDLLGGIRNGVLFITGMQDQIIPVSSTLGTVARLPGAWLNVMAEGGHASLHQYPYELTRLVFDFLDVAQPMSETAAAFTTYGRPYTCDELDNSCGNKVFISPPPAREWATS